MKEFMKEYSLDQSQAKEDFTIASKKRKESGAG